MTKRAIIYARTSYDDRDTDGRNLAGQLEMGRNYCRKKGYSIAYEMAEDNRGASGAEINLPQLNKALEMAKNGLFDVLVVRELDRLSRDVGKLYIVEKELRRYKVGIEYVLTDFPNTPAGQLMKNIYASFAQFEKEEIRLRMMRGKRNKVSEGSVIMANNGPYGYDKYTDGRLTKLRQNPVEAPIVRKIFTWYTVDLLPIIEIARRLDAMNAPLPDVHVQKRKHGWHPSTIRDILHDTKYIAKWGYTYDGSEKINVDIPEIVEEDLWEAAQTRLEENIAFRKQMTKYEYLFGRRLICGRCGKTMVCFSDWQANTLYLNYVCGGEKRDRRFGCKGYRVRADLVDSIAWAWLSALLKDPDKLQAEIDIYKNRSEIENRPVFDQIDSTDELLVENRGQLQRLVDLYMSGVYSLEDVQERKSRLEHTIHSLEDQRANLAARLEGQALTNDQVDDLQAFAADIRGRLDTASYQEKAQLFRVLNVTGRLTIEGGRRVFNVQCVLRTKPDKFVLKNASTG